MVVDGECEGKCMIKEGDVTEAIEHSRIQQLNIVLLWKLFLIGLNIDNQFSSSTALSNCASLQTLALFDLHKAHPSILSPQHLMSFIDEYEMHPQGIV